MNHYAAFMVASLGLFGVGCSAGDPSQNLAEGEAVPGDVGATGEALCVNQAGTGAVLASLAVAAASELRRWNAPADFQWNTTTGMLEVSATGRARCGGTCKNIDAILSLQKNEAHHQVYFPGGVLLDSYTLRGVLQSHYNRQRDCNYYWGAYSTNGCWVEAHDLWFWKKAPGTCATDNYFFANKAGSSAHLDVPERLNYQLYFAGYPDNPFLNFRNYSTNVVIDPTIGLTEANTTSSGSCAATCTQYSTTNLTGRCCSCNGLTKTFSRSAFSPNMYLCK